MIEPNVKTILEAAQTIFDRIPESLRLAKNVCSEQRFTKEMFISLQNVNKIFFFFSYKFLINKAPQ